MKTDEKIIDGFHRYVLTKVSSMLHRNYLAFGSFINKEQWGVFVVCGLFTGCVVFWNDVLCSLLFWLTLLFWSTYHSLSLSGSSVSQSALFRALLTLSSVPVVKLPVWILLASGVWGQCHVNWRTVCGWLVVSFYPCHLGPGSAPPHLAHRLNIPPLVNINMANILLLVDLHRFQHVIWKECVPFLVNILI